MAFSHFLIENFNNTEHKKLRKKDQKQLATLNKWEVNK